MAWTPISNTVPQYEDNGIAASGFYIKFYASGTTTPIPMATDSTGGTTLAKCVLSTEGYPLNGSSAVFIPHIDQKYKIALYRNETDADNNTIASAVWPVDLMSPQLNSDSLFVVNYQAIRDYAGTEVTLYSQGQVTAGDGGESFFQKKTGAAPGTYIDDNLKVIIPTGGDGSIGWVRELKAKEYTTIALAAASLALIEGDVVKVKDRGNSIWDVVLTSSVTPNTRNIVVGTGIPTLSLVLRVENVIRAEEFGLTGSGDESTLMQAVIDYAETNKLPVDLGAGGSYTNIILPAGGITVFGRGPLHTIITNTSTTTPVFTTSSSLRSLWVDLRDFKIISKDSGGDAIYLKDYEHITLHKIEASTAPAERSLGTGIKIERTVLGANGFYLDIEACKIDKHDGGIYVKGGSGYNCNANWVKDCITNDNTSYNIKLEHCSGVEIRGGSRELAAQNIILADCTGCNVISGYFERPDTDNIELINCEGCSVIGALLSSSGNVTPAGAAGVKVTNSTLTNIAECFFVDTFTSFDVIVDASSLYSDIRNNRKKDRINGFTQFRVEVSDLGTDTNAINYRKTAAGSVFLEHLGSVNNLVGQLTTQAGKEISISQTDAKIYAGTGTPEGAVTASRGSIFLRTNGGGGFTFYVKETGDATNTGWVAK
jgi:hypothetical protein